MRRAWFPTTDAWRIACNRVAHRLQSRGASPAIAWRIACNRAACRHALSLRAMGRGSRIYWHTGVPC